MDLAFKILGIVFLVILVILLLVFFYIRRKWRQLKEMAEMDGPMPPMKIHLNEDLDPTWKEEEEAAAGVKEIQSLGFVEGKAYSIKEMPNVVLVSLFNRDNGACAVLSKHDRGFVWTDFFVEYEDGNDLTVSNAPMGGEMESRPEANKITLEEASVPELYDVFKKELEPRPKKQLDDGNFRSVFEESYQKDMEWLAQQGGVSEEVLRKIAEQDDMDFDEEDVQEALQELKLKEILGWHDACLENVLEMKNIPPEKWDFYKSKLFIVSDLMFPPAFIEYLDDQMDFSIEQYESFQKLATETESITDLFLKINGSLSPDLRAKRVGRASSPMQVEIYRKPNE